MSSCGCYYSLDSLQHSVSSLEDAFNARLGALKLKYQIQLDLMRNNQLILHFPSLQSPSPIQGSELEQLLYFVNSALKKEPPYLHLAQELCFLRTFNKEKVIDITSLISDYLEEQVIFDLCSEIRRKDIKTIFDAIADPSFFEPWTVKDLRSGRTITYKINPISKEEKLLFFEKIKKAVKVASDSPTLSASKGIEILAFLNTFKKLRVD